MVAAAAVRARVLAHSTTRGSTTGVRELTKLHARFPYIPYTHACCRNACFYSSSPASFLLFETEESCQQQAHNKSQRERALWAGARRATKPPSSSSTNPMWWKVQNRRGQVSAPSNCPARNHGGRDARRTQHSSRDRRRVAREGRRCEAVGARGAGCQQQPSQQRTQAIGRAAGAEMEEEAPPPQPPSPCTPAHMTDDDKRKVIVDIRMQIAGDVADDPEGERFCTDATIERFARAMGYDVNKALEFLRKTLKWRAEKKPWAVECEGCASNPRTHSLRCVGVDKDARPVLYHCFGQADQRFNPAHNSQHLMRILEDCTRYMDAQEPQVAQWVWIFDFHGYGLWDNNPTTVIQAAQFLPMHPNRLFKVIMLDAPVLFNAMWQLASGYLSEITKAKIMFCSLDDLRDSMEPWAGQDITEWVHAEAVDNRARTAKGGDAASSKTYWQAPEGDAHDPRGPAAWVKSPHYFQPVQWSRAEGEDPAAETKRSGSWLWG